ncbi:MAG: PHB depolymerase family esterase [Gemmatimonadaceae bacterium]
MRSRGIVLATVLLLLSLPVVLLLVEAVTHHVRNRGNGSIVSSGQKREYVLHVPKSYDPAKLTPLVISMHGAGLWGAAQKEISQWNRVADEHGLIVVYPSGASGRGVRVWRAATGSGNMRDVRFISDLIDTLRAAYNIDSTRVYADGLSNGGGMAFVLSCTLSDRIAAVGLVASAQLLPWDSCKDPRPVPMIAFHGTADRYTPYNGGMTWIAPRRFPSIPTWTANWARRNRCAPNPIDSAVAPDVIRRAYTNCADDAAVVLYTVLGGGHTWPGGGPLPEWFVGSTTNSIDASRQMWEFFREHRLPD